MNEAKFLEIIKEHNGIIYKVCHLYRNGREDKEDLFQEIVFQLWKSYASFKENAKLSTWIYKVALNTALSTFRKKSPAIDYLSVLPEPVCDTDTEEENNRELLFVVIKQLSETDRAILTLYFEELTYREIGEIIGITENNVNVKMNRIKIRLKKLLNA
jgi:RNA polymerase sigma-70 factor (ECF subfamily)